MRLIYVSIIDDYTFKELYIHMQLSYNIHSIAIASFYIPQLLI